MSLNTTPNADRIHIGIFGRRNAGKSSLINAITGQDLAIVSDVKGTTTDPVSKAMELLPLGPVVLIDTPGLDDEGELGAQRVQRSYQVLNKTDLALLVLDRPAYDPAEKALIKKLENKHIPFAVAVNYCDQNGEALPGVYATEIAVSAKEGRHIDALKRLLASLVPEQHGAPLIRDLLQPGDFVVLVVPIDSAAPKGRLILPQQQTIRDILDGGANAVVCKDTELPQTLSALQQMPKLVVTDSQVFGKVKGIVPPDIPLTSFSILFARHKGNLEQCVKGAAAIASLRQGDDVLICEGCTHHRQCDDIGTVKLPKWLQAFTGKKLRFHFTSGGAFPEELAPYKLIVHCGGCMLNEREMQYRLGCAADQNVPITNYGMMIAYVNGILERALAPFPALSHLLQPTK